MKRTPKKTAKPKTKFPGGTVRGTKIPKFNRANRAHVESSNAAATTARAMINAVDAPKRVPADPIRDRLARDLAREPQPAAEPSNRDRAFRIAQIEPEYFSKVCDTLDSFVSVASEHYAAETRKQWVPWQLAPDSDPEERVILVNVDDEGEEHPANQKFPTAEAANDFAVAEFAAAHPARAGWGFEIKYQSAEQRAKTGYAVLRDPKGEYAGTVPEFRAAQIVDAMNRAEPIAGGLDQESTTAEAYREAAKREHQHEGECEIDAGAIVSQSDDEGAYVAAWVWVNDEEAGITREAAEPDPPGWEGGFAPNH